MYSLVVGGSSGRGTRRFHVVYSGSEPITRTHDLDDALAVLQKEVLSWIAGGARNRTFLHAGVVAVDGWALLLPGRSGVGKSHLVAALLKAGATYLSDEYAPLDARGRVHPFPLPLKVTLEAEDANQTGQIEARILGAPTEVRPLPVGGVVICSYRSGARWQPRRLSPGHGVLRLLDSAVAARISPARTLETLSALVSAAAVVVGARGEATACAHEMIEWFTGSPDRLRRAS